MNFKAIIETFASKIKKQKYLVLIFTILLLGSILRLYNLDKNEFWMDEAEVIILTKNVLRYGFPVAKIDYRYLIEPEMKPGGGINKDDIWIQHSWGSFYILAFSSIFLGWSEFSTRLPFVFFGILSLIFVYLLARELYGEEVGLYSIFLSSFSIFLINHDRQTRYYSLEVFGLLSSFYFFIKALKMNRLRDWILSSMCFVFLFHANYAFSLVAIILAIFYFIYTKGRGSRFHIFSRNFSIFLLILFSLTVPWFLYAQPWKLIGITWTTKTDFERTIFYIVGTIFKEIPLPLFILGVFLSKNKLSENLFLILWMLVYILFPILLNYSAPRGLLLFYIGSIIFLSLTIKRTRELLHSKFKSLSRYIAITLLFMIPFTSVLNLQFYKISENEKFTKIWSTNKDISLYYFNFYIDYKHYNSLRLSYEPLKCELCRYILSLSKDLYGPNRAAADFIKGNANQDDIIISNAETLPHIVYTNLKVYPLRHYPKSFFENLTKEKNIWFIYRRYWDNIPNDRMDIFSYWINKCRRYKLNAPDLVWGNNPDFPIYEFPEDLDLLEIYHCERKLGV